MDNDLDEHRNVYVALDGEEVVGICEKDPEMAKDFFDKALENDCEVDQMPVWEAVDAFTSDGPAEGGE